MNVGTEWLIDAEGCPDQFLCSLDALQNVCKRVIIELGLSVVGQGTWHKFPEPGGITGLFLLTESHLACHTYPEAGIATFNLYCCLPRPRWPWEVRLKEMLGAKSVTVRLVTRGKADQSAVSAAPTAESRAASIENEVGER